MHDLLSSISVKRIEFITFLELLIRRLSRIFSRRPSNYLLVNCLTKIVFYDLSLLPLKITSSQRRRRCYYVKYCHLGTLTIRSHWPVHIPLNTSIYLSFYTTGRTHLLFLINSFLYKMHHY